MNGPDLGATCWRIIERLPYGLIIHDGEGEVLFANTAAGRLAGVSDGDALLGRPIASLFVPPFLRDVRAQLLGLEATSDGPNHTRERLRCFDGTSLDVQVSATPFVAGRRGEVQLVFHDIGARVRAEAALERAVAQLRAILAQLPGVLWTTDREGRVTATHSDYRPVAAQPQEAEASDDLLEVAPGRSLPSVIGEVHARAIRGELAAAEMILADRVVAVEMAPLRDGEEIVGTVGLATDVTRRRVIERRRREQQRVEAVARLAGGVAHEINNVLATVMAHAELLGMSWQGHPSAEDVRAIAQASRRGSGIAARLLGFAGGGMYRRGSVAVRDVMAAAAARAQDDVEGAVEVRLELEDSRSFVEGDEAQLSAVLDALTENALAATPAGGRLVLRAEVVELSASEIPIDDTPPGPFVRLDVEDTGTGMGDSVLQHAFEPFFSGTGNGPGLGLSMTYGVVRHHGGFVELTSQVGVGTRARLFLPAAVSAPAAPRSAPAPPADTPPSTPTAHRGTVLVVDDVASVLHVARRLLTRIGYSVIEASDGLEALAAFEAHRRTPGAEPLAFVLLDLRMPKMGGDEVLRRMMAIDPEVRVIICTGYSRDQVTQGLFGLGRVGFVQKPFDLEDIRRQIALITEPGERS